MTKFTMGIGDEQDLVSAVMDDEGWRILVRGRPREAGADTDDLHAALRSLAVADADLARDAFAVVMNCPGAWEDEYTEFHGEDALDFDEWLFIVAHGYTVWVEEDGGLALVARGPADEDSDPGR
ncbi:hypothetical protein [Paraconexibacter sp.]|uniref:hypothetical protein n=1 Tax=Paraconexibacter sp. TaxID=2949640 RepID=UPI0035629649